MLNVELWMANASKAGASGWVPAIGVKRRSTKCEQMRVFWVLIEIGRVNLWVYVFFLLLLLLLLSPDGVKA